MRTLSGSSLEWTARTEEVPLRELIAVPVDVGKSSAMVMACDFSGRVLLPAVEFALTRAGVEAMLARVLAAVPAGTQLVRVGSRRPVRAWKAGSDAVIAMAGPQGSRRV